MCLAIPAKVIEVDKEEILAEVKGQKIRASTELVKPKIGDYVLVYGGFVMDIIDKKQAEKILKQE
ncbi:MAG: HypC/HybG/HupF family hydrogenase formation chaperone [Candidatus Aenigmatarchaeota archaeon]|nr:MAG: HypC/HybG/HupF family hydrogenase formation chaperone [Candidatus Aenigmarchaeota archaeon]